MAKRWSKKDNKRVAATLTLLAGHVGGWQAMATALGLTSRATTQSWQSRGRVPVEHCKAIIDLAAAHGITLTAGDLNPDARLLEEAHAE